MKGAVFFPPSLSLSSSSFFLLRRLAPLRQDCRNGDSAAAYMILGPYVILGP